jgi:hypothetical protein
VENPRPGFLYRGDEDGLMALRDGHWKILFAVQRAEGFKARQEPILPSRFPMLVNIRTHASENAEVCASRLHEDETRDIFEERDMTEDDGDSDISNGDLAVRKRDALPISRADRV